MLVVIESPYAGDVEKNVGYARDCMLDSLARGEAPFASHLLYPQVLDDNIPEDRKLGILCNTLWIRVANLIAVYEDYGVSKGMQLAIDFASENGIPIERRKIIL